MPNVCPRLPVIRRSSLFVLSSAWSIAAFLLAMFVLQVTAVQPASAAADPVISVVSYRDNPIDGTYNGNETLIAGIKFTLIALDGEEIETISSTASISAPAQFTPLPAGKYWVCQEDSPGWFNTDPGTIDGAFGRPCKGVDTNGGAASYQLYFGIAEWPRLRVEKIEDLDGDGEVDAGESRLAGFTMTVYDANGNQVAQGVSTVGATPSPEWSLPPGDYTVCETMQDGWRNTNPPTTDPNFGDRPCLPITLSTSLPGVTRVVRFLNAPWPRLRVQKVEDLDGDGEVDAGEIRLADFVMTVYDATGSQVAQDKTTAGSTPSPEWSLPPGTYTVCETLQPGWISTDPATTDPNFGNRPCKSILLSTNLPGIARVVTFMNAANCFGVDATLARSSVLQFSWSDGYSYDILRSASDPYFTAGTVIASNVTTGAQYNEPDMNTPGASVFYVVGDSANCGDRLGMFNFAIVSGN